MAPVWQPREPQASDQRPAPTPEPHPPRISPPPLLPLCVTGAQTVTPQRARARLADGTDKHGERPHPRRSRLPQPTGLPLDAHVLDTVNRAGRGAETGGGGGEEEGEERSVREKEPGLCVRGRPASGITLSQQLCTEALGGRR